MARTRSGQDLINDAYKRADNENATDRHPRTDVLRYVNQGAAELYDLLIKARGADFYRSSTNITTTASTSTYALPAGFYRLISVRVNGDSGGPLVPFDVQEEALLRLSDFGAKYPTHYSLWGNNVELLPYHDADQTIVLTYVPSPTDLTDSPSSYFDGISGWEEYVTLFAARCMAIKDEDYELAAVCKQDMESLKLRIAELAPKRDNFRAKRVRDVRGPQAAVRPSTRRWS